MAFHRTGQSLVGLGAGRVDESRAHEEPEQHRQNHDHQWAADKLRGGELPAHQQSQDDAQFHDQVRRADFEGHGGGEIGAFAKQRPGQRDRRIGARRRCGAQPGSDRQRSRPIIAEQRHDGRAAHESLHDGGQRETQDQRPQNFPRHGPGQRQRVSQRMCHGTSNPVPPWGIPIIPAAGPVRIWGRFGIAAGAREST